MPKCPIRSLASLSLLVREVKRKKAYCLSTSVPVFLLSPLLSGLVFVKYPDWNQEGKKFIAGMQLCTKSHQKNLGGINVRETEDTASSKQNFWTQGYDLA